MQKRFLRLFWDWNLFDFKRTVFLGGIQLHKFCLSAFDNQYPVVTQINEFAIDRRAIQGGLEIISTVDRIEVSIRVHYGVDKFRHAIDLSAQRFGDEAIGGFFVPPAEHSQFTDQGLQMLGFLAVDHLWTAQLGNNYQNHHQSQGDDADDETDLFPFWQPELMNR